MGKGVNATIDQVARIDYQNCTVTNVDFSYCGHMMISAAYLFLTKAAASPCLSADDRSLIYSGSGWPHASDEHFEVAHGAVRAPKLTVSVEIAGFRWQLMRLSSDVTLVDLGGIVIRVVEGQVPVD